MFLTILAAAAPAFGADPACTAVFDALKKVITTPAHGYSTVTMDVRPNQTELSEIIYTGGMKQGYNGLGIQESRPAAEGNNGSGCGRERKNSYVQQL